MNKLEQAAQNLLDYFDIDDCGILFNSRMEALREALADQAEQEPVFSSKCPKCNHKVISTHIGEVWWCPKCQHEWPFEKAEQEPFDMDDHPPHRLCECRKCMEYFTPLPDCDAFAASGKPIAEQTNTQFMEGYRIGLAEMREKCAKVCDEWNWSSKHGSNPSGQLAVLAAAIRAIKFEGDTGFRPVSEMIAEHKQDPKKAAAIEKAKMRKAEQKPVAWYLDTFDEDGELDYREYNSSNKFSCGLGNGTPLYAAPVRTKDLTDDEIFECYTSDAHENTPRSFARAVIAADREKNK